MLGHTSYNWDDIQVGRVDLNHSENFFTQKHFKHEKFSEEFLPLQEAMAEMNIKDSFSNDVAIQRKQNKENIGPLGSTNKQSNDNLLSPTKVDRKSIKVDNGGLEADAAAVKSPSPSPSNSKRRPANLLTKFKTPTTKTSSSSVVAKNSKAAPTAAKVEPPHAYEFKDIYKKKKEEMIKKLLEEEKKNRVFHSRPVPKTKPVTTVPKTQFDYILTVPKTPVVLKNSLEAMEKRRQRLEELRKQNAPQKFTSRKPIGLHEEPFKPKKTSQPLMPPQPFKLNVERRLEERKQYDEQNRIAAEEKKKQEEEERKKREEELVKEIRKLASFKARPNPFK